MSDFKVIEIINSNTIRVSPSWKLTMKDTTFIGDKVNIRGLDDKDNATIKSRLEQLLLNIDTGLNFNNPELIEYSDEKNAVVSCSLYLSKTNILFYFPEYVHKT